jgi:two-component system sensor histidine kinase KdpD
MTTHSAGGSGSNQVRSFVGSALLVAVSTMFGLAMEPRWGNAAVDLLFLPAVLGAAILGGLRPALFAAFASALAYNFFFTVPRHTFRIQDPADIVTVIVLFLVAVVASHLAASVRKQAQLAAAHAARNATIAGFARQLLSCASEEDIAEVISARLGALFDCNAIIVHGLPEPTTLPPSLRSSLTPSDIAAAALTLETGEPAGRGVNRVDPAQWQFRPIRAGDEVLAAAGLARDDGMPPITGEQLELLESLLDQAALALERARLESEARGFAASRERDRLRAALLATVAQDVRPSLGVIDSVVARLRREGLGDKAAVSELGAEALKLDRYVSNLLDLGSGADDQPIVAGDVVIDLPRRTVRKGSDEVHLTPKEFAVLAELAKYRGRVLSNAHLLRTVWGPAQERHADYLRVAIRALRQKLENDPKQPALIINEPSVGYRLAA